MTVTFGSVEVTQKVGLSHLTIIAVFQPVSTLKRIHTLCCRSNLLLDQRDAKIKANTKRTV